MKVDLPGDGWAELREPSDLRAKDKIAVQRAMVFSLLGNQENGEESRIPVNAGMAEDISVALLCRVIVSWSREEPMPLTPDVIDELPIDVYQALCDAIEPHLLLVRSAPKRKTLTA
jgi:hypothetical protein